MKIAGRKYETQLLQSLLEKDTPEFVAVYGRRRVGKTYLVEEVYKNKIVFGCSGLHNKNLSHQLENFWLALQEYSAGSLIGLPPKTWLQAFSKLKIFLNSLKGKGKKVIFLDEIPWFETPRSGFLAALGNFWNTYCSKHSDLILVICGSAASWIIKKVINDRGGLHNRVTTHIKLMPFTLFETKQYLEKNHVHLTLKDIVQLYMCIGGIPYYLSHVRPGRSVPQILDDLFFLPQASLKQEFSNLYAALFKNSALHERIVAALATKNKGLNRSEIISSAGIPSGSSLTLALKELTECGFIEKTIPYFQKNEMSVYRLADEFSLFHFKFLEKKSGRNSWLQISNQSAFNIWSGFAFENICLKHIAPIKQTLGISGIITNEYSWLQRGKDLGSGAQVDLVIDRSDNCINLLEIKFHNKE